MFSDSISFDVSVPVSYHNLGLNLTWEKPWQHSGRILQDCELLLVTKNTFHVAALSKQYTLNEGDYLLLPSNAYQKGWKPGTPEFFWMRFDAPYQSATPTSGDGIITIPIYGKIQSYTNIVGMLKHLQRSIVMYHDGIQNNYICTNILCQIANQMAYADKKFVLAGTPKAYDDVVKYIQDNIGLRLLVSDIAKYFGYNEKYLSHMFSVNVGTPLKQFIFERKMDLAKYLLSNTTSNIVEISLRCGFNDEHNFMHIFKKIIGLRPSEYRRNLQNKP